jgi:hypothetical protein
MTGVTGQAEWNVLQPSDEDGASLGEEIWAGYSGWSPKAATFVVWK